MKLSLFAKILLAAIKITPDVLCSRALLRSRVTALCRMVILSLQAGKWVICVRSAVSANTAFKFRELKNKQANK